MNVVVEIAGQQYKVSENDTVKAPKLTGKPGDTVEFNNILLKEDSGNVTVGTPNLDGKVTAKIVEHGRDEKILVFHKKRRKGYRKLNGHRAHYTTIEITGIETN